MESENEKQRTFNNLKYVGLLMNETFSFFFFFFLKEMDFLYVVNVQHKYDIFISFLKLFVSIHFNRKIKRIVSVEGTILSTIRI